MIISYLFKWLKMSLKINSLFNNLDDENVEAFRHLSQANNISEWIWTYYLKSIVISIIGLITMALLSVLNCYLTEGNFDIVHLYRPIRIVYAIGIKFKLITTFNLIRQDLDIYLSVCLGIKRQQRGISPKFVPSF